MQGDFLVSLKYSLRSELIDSDLVQVVLNPSQLIQNGGSTCHVVVTDSDMTKQTD